MKAIAVKPPQPATVHLAELEMPTLDSIPDDRGVLVKVLQVGVDATDREINDGLYGAPPPGSEFLVLGHEAFGRVVEVGSAVRKVKPGDYVSCTVRRPGTSVFDQIGRNDITSEETYYERGINLRHGYLTEFFVDDEEFMVRIPDGITHLGVLAEPMSVVAKGIEQAMLAQQRLQVWEPRVAFVLGSGQIGLLATLALRLQGLDVYTFARAPAEDNLKAHIADAYGARYVSTRSATPQQITEEIGAKPDLIFEATGNSRQAFGAMEYLNLNGALIWSSVTGGEREISVPADRINLEWVLGNKLLVGTVNGNRKHFARGIADLALGEVMYPGVTERILTHPVRGLDNYAEMMELLETGQCLKVYVQVADDD